MGSAKPPASRSQRRRPSRGRPSQGGLSRNRAAVAATAVVAALLITVLVTSNDGDRASTRSSPAGIVGGDFHSLAADPATPGRLFVGGHQAVSTSTDGGRGWSRVAALDDADAMGWGFTEGAVYVSGHPGIIRSADGAQTFRSANEGLPDTDVHAFGAGSTLYAAGPANGVRASLDGGRTWSPRTTAAGQSFFGRILVGPDDDQRLVAADARSGVVESTDGGRSWRPLGGPAGALWVSRSGGDLYASDPRGAARSPDGGKTWQNLALPRGASLVEADPFDGRVLYAGIHEGEAVRVLVSRDSGGEWSSP